MTVIKTYLIFDQHFLILDHSMLPRRCLHNLQTDLPNSFYQQFLSNVKNPIIFENFFYQKLESKNFGEK